MSLPWRLVIAVLTVLLGTLGQCAIEFRSPGRTTPLNNTVSVGNGSDVVIAITCLNTDGGTYNWQYINGSMVPDPLMTFGISQDLTTGVLRIYPAPLIEQDGFNMFTCISNGSNDTITLILFESLFFTESIPSFLPIGNTLDCIVPDIPFADVTFDAVLATNASTNASCLVSSDRGSFSRLIPIREPEIAVRQFVIDPVNTTVAMDDTAAFACIIDPVQSDSYSLINITWMFQSLTEGSGFMEVEITEGVSSEFIGTSILQINMTDMFVEGMYYCIAYYNDNINVTSDMATLLIDNMTQTIDQFLVRPPSSFITTEGNTVTLPCISTNITWSYEGTMIANETNIGVVFISNTTIRIESISRTAQGLLTCTNNDNGNVSTVNLTVLAPLQFDSTPNNETTVMTGSNLTIECVASGNPTPYNITWLRNNTEITTDRIIISGSTLTLFNAQPNDTAIYQCVAMTTRERISAYTYLIVEFIEDIHVSPSTIQVNPLELVDFNLTCTVLSHPLVIINWNVTTSIPRQVPVGFRGPSVSELILNSGDFIGRNILTCSAELNQIIVMETITVNAFSPVTITVQPETTPPVIIGYTVSFLCEAQSIPAPDIEWFQSSVGTRTPVTPIDNTILINTIAINSNTTMSNLTITVANDTDFSQYYCRASNDLFNASSNPANLTRGEVPSITNQPQSVILAQGESGIFICTARGIPLPMITWIVTPLTSFINSTTEDAPNIRSSINITAISNETRIQCTATNIFANNQSIIVFVIFAGPPLAPNIVNVDNRSRSATVMWDKPFSLIRILDYIITLEREGVVIDTFISEDITIIIDTLLVPFTIYKVGVVARNRVGNSTQSPQRQFETAQAAPDAPPTNITTSAIALGEILLSWLPPPSNLTNGIIISYDIRYRNIDSNNNELSIDVGSDARETTLSNLINGVTYSISIFAVTVGDGVAATIFQDTITAPPDIVNVFPVVSATDSTNSFPITISSFLSTDAEFVWIVVIKTSNNYDASLLPDNVYPNNDTFIFASQYTSDNIPFDQPYVAAEVSTSNPDISFPYFFLIGDQTQTDQINDNSIYSNPSLRPGTSYTAFIRVFPPAPSEGIVTKRDTGSLRQYTVFSSTRFVPIVRTASTPGLSGGEVAGIIIAILLLIVVLIIVGVVIAFLWRSPHYYKHNLPPPSRKGSVRLRESQKLLDSPFPHVRHNKGNEIVTIVRNHHSTGSEPLSPLVPPDERVPIAKGNFTDYVRTLHANSDHLFAEEYELIGIKSPSLSHQASQSPWNQAKNRYANINSYDKTRVLLNEISGVQGSDYVNANYIAGYKDTIYIAGQGSLPETTQDFWRMVWEQDSCRIIMLTNTIEKGRTKCHQYWPSTGSISFNDFTITMVDQQILAYYTIRTFILNMGNDRREVKQFHYTSWPDFGVPDHPSPIIGFIRRVNNSARKTDGPDIIHCSAGVGRTGTYITIQSMMQMIEEEDRLDVFNFVLGMRHERNLMVQTEAQYIFIHDSIVEFLKIGDTEISLQRMQKEYKLLTDTASEDDVCQLEQQFDTLNSLDIPDPSNYVSAILPINKDKNRFPDVLPYEPYRIRLLMQPGILGSDYINASYIDGYLRRNQFILTQGPLQNTVNDFWRMIWEHRVSAIVMLCSVEERGKEQSTRYWPSDKITQYGDMFIEKVKEQDNGFYCIRELQITHTKQNNDIRSLKQFHYSEWPEEKCPNSSTLLLDMIALVQKAHHLYGGGPVVVHDSSSIGRAGTFCVMNIVIERLKVEGMVDVFFTIHSLRRKHPGIVATYDQYLFCFNTVREYLDSFDKYSNFE